MGVKVGEYLDIGAGFEDGIFADHDVVFSGVLTRYRLTE